MKPPRGRGRRALVDVAVLDTVAGAVIDHQTVVVDGSRILAVGPADRTPLPPGTRVVWDSGGLVLPGLADMHVHVHGEADLLLFLLHGVTTVRNMWGTSRHLAWRRGIEDGRILGPTLYTTGPIVDGAPPYWNGCVPLGTAEAAVEEVRRQKSAGYSAVKVYNNLTRDVYDTIVAEANRQGLPVVGHVPKEVELAGALAAGQRSIEHLEGWLEAIQSTQAPWRGRPLTSEEYLRAGDFIDPTRIPQVADEVAKSGSWSCPTLIVYEAFASPSQVGERLARPEMRWCPPKLLAHWDPSKDFRLRSLPQEFWDRMPAVLEGRRGIVRALRASGARLIVGTDTPNPWVVPGYSLHSELERLVQCGYSNLEVLQMATARASEFLGTPGEFGVIRPGARADLLLVEDNPLVDLSVLRHPRGVMVQGRWLSEGELERLSGALLRSYSAGDRRMVKSVREASAQFPKDSATFAIEVFGRRIGMETVAPYPPNGEGPLTARLALDAPPGVSAADTQWVFHHGGRLARHRTRFGHFEGPASIAFVRSRAGFKIRDSPTGSSGAVRGEVSAPPDAIAGPVQVASFLPLVDSLRGLAPGAKLARTVLRIDPESGEVAMGELTAQGVAPDPEAPGSGSRFDLEERLSNGKFSGTIDLSAEWRIVRLRWLGGTEEWIWTPFNLGPLQI